MTFDSTFQFWCNRLASGRTGTLTDVALRYRSNVGQASFYSCGFPAMIKAWRELFKVPDLWFGFVQIANFRYSVPVSINDYRQTASRCSHQTLCTHVLCTETLH